MGHTIQETTVTVFIGNYIRRVNVIKGSLYSRVYGSRLSPHLGMIQSALTIKQLTNCEHSCSRTLCIEQLGSMQLRTSLGILIVRQDSVTSDL